ncbi:amidohydrolase family protein [Streptomyces telluris]|uniref:Amidohydrolase family protein n=1 Tax=Streptomyces telluris TaxID=2720021 RepID=A0A9X2LD98_9ACTN|nr:amidohydrolase family protein [Streptomyces telluris]MCQ8768996.1 amidohydrolase family protein [Streptomyces telluris]NJP80019.1 amidohydrolase family protein [Streptomyces telluris]
MAAAGGTAAFGGALALGGTEQQQARAATPHGAPARPLALTHATLIAAPGAQPPRPGMTVLVRDGRIELVGPTAEVPEPPDARVVDLDGKYVVPGLIALRVSGSGAGTDDPSGEAAARLSGVTTVAGPGSPSVDGLPALWPGSVEARDEAAARRAVRRAVAGGAAFVGVHPRLSRPAYRALAEEARIRRIPYGGHCPDAVPLAEASDAGQRIVEHLYALLLAASTRDEEIRHGLARIGLARMGLARIGAGAAGHSARRNAHPGRYRDWLRQIRRLEWTAVRSYYPDRADRLFDHLAANGTWVAPSLTAHHSLEEGETDSPYLRGIRAHRLHLVAELHRRGVPVLAGGTHADGLHEEMEQLAGAGLGAAEALRAATAGPARALGLADETGTVEPGRAADLVVLDADPLRDITAVRRIAAVVVRGRLITK